MKVKTHPRVTVRTMLRVGLTLMLLVILNIPHVSMASVPHAPTVVMSHVSQANGAMTQGYGVHERIDGSLCATICAGTNATESAAVPACCISHGVVRFRLETARVWVPPTPDAALRPPDLLQRT